MKYHFSIKYEVFKKYQDLYLNGDSSGSFQWKISGSNETTEKVVRFAGRNVPNGNSRSICSNLIFDTSFMLSRPFSVQQQLIRELGQSRRRQEGKCHF